MGGAISLVVVLGIIVFFIAGAWKMFEKAGEAGWKVLIPIYNLWILMEISGKPGWWGLLMCIPIVSLIVWILAAIKLAERFGKSEGFVVGLVLLTPVFAAILGFDSSEYRVPAAA